MQHVFRKFARRLTVEYRTSIFLMKKLRKNDEKERQIILMKH